jgi:hypothetical protein
MKFLETTKQMQEFLKQFLDYIKTAEKNFTTNNERIATLNKYLYEYEVHSV